MLSFKSRSISEKSMASISVRNMATVAGNVCNASPVADTSPMLIALDAKFVLASANGTREVVAEDFFVGPGVSVKEANELDLRDMLLTCLKQEYLKGVQANGGEHFSTPAELQEHLEDGVQIIEWFKKRRAQYFSTKNQELVGIK